MVKVLVTNREAGQTLIETLVGIFILVTGLISATTLAVYSFNATDSSSKQVVGTALAREGIEAIKNIRDTYWLNDVLVDCSPSMGSGQVCYRNWQGTGQGKLMKNSTYAVDFAISGGNPVWILDKHNGSTYDFTLNYDPATGQYQNIGPGTPSIYARRIDIDEDNNFPYSVLDPKLIVTSTVWWKSRQCPQTNNPSSLPSSCKVVLNMYLTNWKNY